MRRLQTYLPLTAYSLSWQVVCFIIVSQMVPLRDRGKYVGVMYARTAIATVLGPVRVPPVPLFIRERSPFGLRSLVVSSLGSTGGGAFGSTSSSPDRLLESFWYW